MDRLIPRAIADGAPEAKLQGPTELAGYCCRGFLQHRLAIRALEVNHHELAGVDDDNEPIRGRVEIDQQRVVRRR